MFFFDYSCGFPDPCDNGEMIYGELRPAPTAAGFFIGSIDDGARTMTASAVEPCAQR
jgi:hypothetical protein